MGHSERQGLFDLEELMRTHSKLGLRAAVIALVLVCLVAGLALAQDDGPKSPKGSAATQIGEAWITVSYSRPILRGRAGIFGSGDSYGGALLAGAPVWRAGADVTTRITTGLDLDFNGTKVPAGEYSLFIELKEDGWTGILSSQPHMGHPDRDKMANGITWGAYGYDPEHDVVRVPMAVTVNERSIDQMTIVFTDVTDAGGALAVVWDNQIGVLPFTVSQ